MPKQTSALKKPSVRGSKSGRPIMALLVTDANKPVGIVHLHDILRAGVA